MAAAVLQKVENWNQVEERDYLTIRDVECIIDTLNSSLASGLAANFSIEDHLVNILDYTGHISSVTITQLCHYNSKVTVDNM